MPWTATDLIPVNLNIAPIYSTVVGSFPDSITFSVQLKTSSGANFDLTALTGASVNIDQASDDTFASQPIALGVSNMLTNAGKLTGTLAIGQLALCKNKGATSFRLSLHISDGATDLLAATGNFNVTTTP